MAASKKTAKAKGAETALAVSTASFKHGASAYGARYVKKGFGFDDQEDLEWALGWPHVRRLIEGHPLDADPVKGIDEFFPESGFPSYRMDFPREVIARWLRMFLFCPANRDEVNRWHELAKDHIATPGSITDQEARTIISNHLKPVEGLWWYSKFNRLLPLLEAFVGPEVIADALVASVEACSPELLKSSGTPPGVRYNCLSYLGFPLLRLPEASREPFVQRLRKVLDGVAATIPGGIGTAEPGKEAWYAPFRAIDRAINGQSAVTRMGKMMIHADLLFAEDPAFVADWLRQRSGPDDEAALARLVFLGGEAVLDIEAKWWSKYKEPREKDELHKAFIQDYGRIRSEKLLPIFLAMSQSSKARKEAAAWFAAHAAYAVPYLERTAAGSGNEAAWAKALLG